MEKSGNEITPDSVFEKIKEMIGTKEAAGIGPADIITLRDLLHEYPRDQEQKIREILRVLAKKPKRIKGGPTMNGTYIRIL